MASTPMTVTISAPRSEVEELLRETLTPNQLARTKIEAPLPDPLAPERHGETETARVVVEFLIDAIAGGITYDVFKAVIIAAVDRFGKQRVN